ncbi:DUF1501 domain-containing protein [bacterium]|nr:DUF1501 domain-containing protein [bacterium]
MLRLLGSRRQLCDGLSRRDLLHVGGLGLYGLTLGQAQQIATAATSESGLPGFGKAKSCIMLFLFGAAPQHETFDPKPEAAVEIQGELREIATSIPGVAFGEGLPRTAAIADRLTTIRSVTHPFPLHCVAYSLSGMPAYTTNLEAAPRAPEHWPYVGSVADYCWSRQRQHTETGGIPRHIGLPWVFNSQVDDLGLLAGPYAAFLGQQYDPVWAKFEGKATRIAPKARHEQAKEYTDPYAAIDPQCRFVFDGASSFPEQVSLDRFNLRQNLLSQIDTARRTAELAATEQAYAGHQARALSLLTSPQVRNALDVEREPVTLREQYGHTLFGQSCLAARRLVEAGSRFVTVFWDSYGTYFSGGWDTHQNHYPRLKEYLLPGFDAGYASLILDLEQRGLLDETLVLCLSEHGRTPQIDSKPKGAARHHWSQVYSMTMAGGGVHRGAVVGRSDAIGGTVAETPISPKDIHATTYHLLGIDPEQTMPDRQNRPLPIAGEGHVRPELLA